MHHSQVHRGRCDQKSPRYAHVAGGRVTPEPSKGGAGTRGLEGTDTETGGDGAVWASAGCSNWSDEQW